MRTHLQTISRLIHRAYHSEPIRLISIMFLILIAIAVGYDYFFRTQQGQDLAGMLEPVWVKRGTTVTDRSGGISIRYDKFLSPVFERFELDTGEEESIPLMLKQGESGSFLYRGEEYFFHLLEVDRDRGAKISIAKRL